MKRRSTDHTDIPAVIPRVEVVDGEPVIATRHVIDPSPVPRSLTIVLLLLAALSVGYTVFQQQQRADDVRSQLAADARADQRIEMIIEDLREQDEQSVRERERLKALIVGLVAAPDRAASEELLRAYLAAEEADPVTAPITPPTTAPAP